MISANTQPQLRILYVYDAIFACTHTYIHSYGNVMWQCCRVIAIQKIQNTTTERQKEQCRSLRNIAKNTHIRASTHALFKCPSAYNVFRIYVMMILSTRAHTHTRLLRKIVQYANLYYTNGYSLLYYVCNAWLVIRSSGHIGQHFCDSPDCMYAHYKLVCANPLRNYASVCTYIHIYALHMCACCPLEWLARSFGQPTHRTRSQSVDDNKLHASVLLHQICAPLSAKRNHIRRQLEDGLFEKLISLICDFCYYFIGIIIVFIVFQLSHAFS